MDRDVTKVLLLMSRLRYVEQELAKKKGKTIDEVDKIENDIKRAEDELYKIPDHLKVSKLYTCFMLFLLVYSYDPFVYALRRCHTNLYASSLSFLRSCCENF